MQPKIRLFPFKLSEALVEVKSPLVFLNLNTNAMKTYFSGKEITAVFIITLFVFLIIYSLVKS